MSDWFDTLKNKALITFPNMPTAFIEDAILDTVSAFFRETELLKDDAYIDAECSIDDYVIDLPEDRAIVQIREVRATNDVERSPLVSSKWRVVPPADGRFEYGYWVDLTAMQPTISINGTAGIRSGRYAVTYTWTPNGEKCELPYHLIGKYRHALLCGVLAKLYLIPTDDNNGNASYAKYYLAEFDKAVWNARVEETQNHTNRPLYMKGGRFL